MRRVSTSPKVRVGTGPTTRGASRGEQKDGIKDKGSQAT